MKNQLLLLITILFFSCSKNEDEVIQAPTTNTYRLIKTQDTYGTLSYIYNADGNLSKINADGLFTAGTSKEYSYSNKQLITMESTTYKTTYSYLSNGKIDEILEENKVILGNSNKTKYAYDAQGVLYSASYYSKNTLISPWVFSHIAYYTFSANKIQVNTNAWNNNNEFYYLDTNGNISRVERMTVGASGTTTYKSREEINIYDDKYNTEVVLPYPQEGFGENIRNKNNLRYKIIKTYDENGNVLDTTVDENTYEYNNDGYVTKKNNIIYTLEKH